jgi:hypothetical protein
VQLPAPVRLVGRVGEREAIKRVTRAVERNRVAGRRAGPREPGIGRTTLLGTARSGPVR